MTAATLDTPSSSHPDIDGGYAWIRLGADFLIGTIGCVGMWSIVVALPAIQEEFGSQRGGASLPYSLTMVGMLIGAVFMGRLADKRGIALPAAIGAIGTGIGYIAASYASSLTMLALIQGLAIGMVGCAPFFAPLMADVSHWFEKRRGLAMGLCASSNYFAGAIWPPVIEHFMAQYGWRATHAGIGIFCIVTILPLCLLLRRKAPHHAAAPIAMAAATAAPLPMASARPLGLHPNLLQGLIMLAGFSCCMAMSMPQVHLVAYCVDLGYGPARGAEMLALMLACGVVSRLTSGWLLDRIGGFATLLLGTTLQCIALAFYLPFDGLASLYMVSAFFGLVQGGIVPSYAYLLRGLYPPAQAGLRISLTISVTMAGMALGGWLSGVIYDATGSYQAAIYHGISWNLLNIAIVAWLILRKTPAPKLAAA